MRAPAKKYILIVRHMGAINLVLSKIVIEMTNNNIDKIMKLKYIDIFLFSIIIFLSNYHLTV
jgi:hypothetical protein